MITICLLVCLLKFKPETDEVTGIIFIVFDGSVVRAFLKWQLFVTAKSLVGLLYYQFVRCVQQIVYFDINDIMFAEFLLRRKIEVNGWALPVIEVFVN